MFAKKNSKIIGFFLKQPVRSNVLLISMLFIGIFCIFKLNKQFFPDYQIQIIRVSVEWQGATAEDIENSITIPLEQELRNVNYLKNMTSSSRENFAIINLEFLSSVNLTDALAEVNDKVNLVKNLPRNAEKPEVTKVINFENVAKLLIVSDDGFASLRNYAHQAEESLLSAGISKIDVEGLPQEEISIQVPMVTLFNLQKSVPQLANIVSEHSRDVPAGDIESPQVYQKLRITEQKRNITQFENIPIVNNLHNKIIYLKDIAHVSKRIQDGSEIVEYNGKPAVILNLKRTEDTDSLHSANILTTWLNAEKNKLPSSLHLIVFDQQWLFLKDRINLLLENGLSGLILLLIILFLFLDYKLALWVSAGIPVSLLAALSILYLFGGSINMISLFALIMTLGIIVDDSIVVGEETLTLFEQGRTPADAALTGASKMWAPVVASSLTTVAAFIPLTTIGGVMGTLLSELPAVAIYVIIASLIEVFFILPLHLKHSLQKINVNKHNFLDNISIKFNQYFQKIQNKYIVKTLPMLLDNAFVVLASLLLLILLTYGLIASGYVKFDFFPSPEGNKINVNIRLNAGSTKENMRDFMHNLMRSLELTERKMNLNILKVVIAKYNIASFSTNLRQQGKNFGSMYIELIPTEERSITAQQFITAWQKNIHLPNNIANFNVSTFRAGPPGKDIDIQLFDQSAFVLKQAAVDIQRRLEKYKGVFNINDNFPYGQQQLVYKLNQYGESLGLTTAQLGEQIRAAYDGHLIQIFNSLRDKLEVKMILDDKERQQYTSLRRLPIIAPNGKIVILDAIVNWSSVRGNEELLHDDGKLVVNVTADVNSSIANSNVLLNRISKEIMPKIINKYKLKYKFAGRFEEQSETLGGMKDGAILAVILIYLILSWIFNSFYLPLLAIISVPFGVIGAIFGHFLLGHDLTILSLFGIFGLSGVIINDVIILISCFQYLEVEHITAKDMIISAVAARFRPICLTSITTISGLTPLLLERSLQAQFLIPMVISLSFGIAAATLIILVIIPILLYLIKKKSI